MAKVDNERSISGKRLLPQLVVGCLLFAALMGFGTYVLAQMMTPYLKKRNEENMKKSHLEHSAPVTQTTSG